MCRISVIVPVYNTELYLKQCLSSIQEQTFRDIEVICVDDGSADGSVAIVNEFCKSDTRFTLKRNKHREGCGAGPARNLGLEFAKGKYVIFLDSDDFFEINMLEDAYKAAESNNADSVVFDAYMHDNKTGREWPAKGALDRTLIGQEDSFSQKTLMGNLFQLTWGGAWNILFSRRLINDNNIRFQEMRYTDDMYFTYLSLVASERIAVLRKCYVHYRINLQNSQSASRHLHKEVMYAAPRKIKNALEERGLFSKYKFTFWKRMVPHILDFLLNQKDFSRWIWCFNYIKDVLIHDFELKEYILCGASDRRHDYYLNMLAEIDKYSALEFLFTNRNRDSKIFISDAVLHGNNRIAIYGAGVLGKKVFCTLLKNTDNKIVTWVDRNYAAIGYPVQKPDVLLSLEYDCVLICVRNRLNVEEIKHHLTELGVAESKILLIG